MNSKIAKKKFCKVFKMHFVYFNFKIVLHTGILEATIRLNIKFNLLSKFSRNKKRLHTSDEHDHL